MLIRLPLLIILAIAAGAGCGRRGELEAPGGPAPGAVTQPEPRPGATPLTSIFSPGATRPAEAAPSVAPERRFILDPLI